MKPLTVPYNFIIPDLPQLSDRFTHVYKLIKSMYGLKQAPKTFFDKLKAGLIEHDFVQSEIDKCLFMKVDLICLVCVDNKNSG